MRLVQLANAQMETACESIPAKARKMGAHVTCYLFGALIRAYVRNV